MIEKSGYRKHMFKYYNLQSFSIQTVRLTENGNTLLDTRIIVNNWKAEDYFHPTLPSAKLNILIPYFTLNITDDILLLMEVLMTFKQYDKFKKTQRSDINYFVSEKLEFISSEHQRKTRSLIG